MKNVEVKFKKISIDSYDPMDESVTYTLIINDGADKAFRRTVKIKNPEETTSALLNELKTKLKEIHAEKDDDDVLSGFTSIQVSDEELEEKINKFFTMVATKISVVKKSKITRLDMKKQVENIKLEWT